MKPSEIANQVGLIRISVSPDGLHGRKPLLRQLAVYPLTANELGQEFGRRAGLFPEQALKLAHTHARRARHVLRSQRSPSRRHDVQRIEHLGALSLRLERTKQHALC